MIKYYWYISIFLRKHGLIVLASVIAAILIFTLSLPVLSKVFEFKKQTYIGIVGTYTLASLPQNIQHEISAGLTQIQDDGSVVPYLTERWNIENDGKTYRFLMKKNISWQDGKPFVAQDVNYNFNDVKMIPSENEVMFQLKDPFSPFPSAVSQPLFRFVEEPYLFFFKRQKVVGLGQYEVTDWQERSGHLTELVLTNTDHTAQKIYRFYLTEADAIDGFKRGEVDVLPDLTSATDLKEWPNVDVTSSIDYNTYVGVFFNADDKLLSSNELRQALNYALQKPTDDTRAIGSISPKSWAFSKVGKTYDFDLNRATERVLSALDNMPHEPLQFNLTTTPLFVDEADSVKQQWESWGEKLYASCKSSASVKDKSVCENLHVQVTVQIRNFPDTSNFQALLIGEQSPTDPDQYSLWHSKQETNFTNYHNTRIDSYLEKGRQTTDQQKRFEIYQNFQQFFSDDAPVIFMHYLTKYQVARKGKLDVVSTN